jgi:hypothetical protein
MLKELFELVKNYAGDTVVNNPDVPNEHNDEVVAEATNTVASGLRNVVAGGGVGSIIDLFKGGADDNNQEQSGISKLVSNPVVAMMVGHFASKLMSKYKIGGNQANNVASSLIPSVIGGLISKNNSGGGDVISNLLNSITGGQAQTAASNQGIDIGSLISQFTGGGQQQQSGGGGLMDIVSQLAGGAQQQQARNGGGGLMDLIKGFMK